MEITIPESQLSTEKKFTLEDIPYAYVYAKATVVHQRRIINQIISEHMGKSYPAVKFPFIPLPQVQNELGAAGWYSQNYSSWFQPLWVSQPDTRFQMKDEGSVIISAKLFYDATLERQIQELIVTLDKERESGLDEIHLDFPLCQELINKLYDKGWTINVSYDYDLLTSKPETVICVLRI